MNKNALSGGSSALHELEPHCRWVVVFPQTVQNEHSLWPIRGAQRRVRSGASQGGMACPGAAVVPVAHPAGAEL